jgi:hypothetical protein
MENAPLENRGWETGTDKMLIVSVGTGTSPGENYSLKPKEMNLLFNVGYGKKTDFKQNKSFDLDKTYRNIIKPAAEAAGYTCERADEVQHAGVIDVPM